jgi:SAM-dependent methyltransferase
VHSKPPGPDTLATLDAAFENRQCAWWDAFYAQRERPVPFFVGVPDESLWKWVSNGLIAPGKALDLGCGNGRNSIHLARVGFSVEGVDFSEVAIAWATQQARDAGVAVRLHHASVFDLPLEAGSYDLVYDSGCFHHMPPHRRLPYVERVADALKPGGMFGMTCFRPEGGSGLSDAEVYERGTLGGGLGYTQAQLRDIWSPRLAIREIRPMEDAAPQSGLFGRSFLWAVLAQRPA